MPIIRHLDRLPEEARRGAVAVGNFDGVHVGHRAIVSRLLERAAEQSGPAVVFTFDPHPVQLLRPEQCPPPLTWTQRKAELLSTIGVDWLIAYPTDAATLALTARQFFDRMIVSALDARAMVEGPNFYFGRNREGDVAALAAYCAGAGMSLDVVPPVEVRGQLASSSQIRQLIAVGDVAAAAELLACAYRIRGMVAHGAKRGAKIGFPTANLGAIDTLLPAAGVYAGRAYWQDDHAAAAINIGPNPTFGEQAHKVEVHLIDREESLYGKPLEVEFVAKLRDVQSFDSADALIAQLHKDVAAAKNAVENERQ